MCTGLCKYARLRCQSVVCGSDAIFIESKGATFSAAAKYGGDPELLQAEIEVKLIKGLKQLASAIVKVFDRKNPEAVSGADLSKIRRIFPVLVTRDDIGAAIYINYYFQQIYLYYLLNTKAFLY